MTRLDKALGQYTETASALEIIRNLGARNIKNPKGEWIIHSCLIDQFDPHHRNGDSNPSAAINRDTKRYNCFGYGSMTLDSLLTLALGNDSKKKVEFLKGIPQEKRATFKEVLLERLAPKPEAVRNEPMSDIVFEGMTGELDYMTEKRGISREVCDAHGIRFDGKMGSIVIPLYEYLSGKKTLVGYQRRNLIKGMPKYANSQDLHKESLLYYGSGARDSKEIILVESIMSVLRLETLGINNAVATLGARVYDGQLSALRRHRSIIVWFDDDFEGVRGAKNFIRKTNGQFKINVVISDIRHHDPADMDLESVRRNLSQRMNLIEAIPFLNKAEKVLKNVQQVARA